MSHWKQVLISLFLISILCCNQAFALDPEQKTLFQENIRMLNLADADASACGSDSTTDAANGKDTAKWQTTLTAPYSLEDFVVEVLRDIAAKEGVSESSTVTQEHTLALIAFAWGEGGNLTNNDIYNPWNTGYSGGDLQPVGGHSTSGVQSYSSFNDGVEATARVMTGTGGSGGYQSRLGTVLKDPSTNAQAVMKALTYYQKYNNNKAWAEASMPPNQESYYKGRLSLVNATKSDYKHRASELIGPPGSSDFKGLHSDHALRYSFGGDSSSSKGGDATAVTDACTIAGAVSGDIIKTALLYAWADPPKNTDSTLKEPKPSYKAANQQFNSNHDTTDCGVFVATVMHASGVDKDYPNSGTVVQLPYVKSHPEKYTIYKENGNWTSADVQPGDIMISQDHTYIYVGKQPNGMSVAEASWGDHVPELDRNAPYPTQFGGSDKFTIVRVKK